MLYMLVVTLACGACSRVLRQEYRTCEGTTRVLNAYKMLVAKPKQMSLHG
jgi:hypothetical protein